jgi:7,8-dihydropterin-6-yl-methyl-4-(beta-D-ribofuranosyl)aminobenzene 5'-phosphate synthase
MREADAVVVTYLVENSIDMLLSEDHVRGICRCGLIEHFDPAVEKPIAENGISIHVAVQAGQREFQYLFDFGLTPGVLTHNARALNVDLTRVDHLVLSHGHPDHFGGIAAALELIGRPVPLATHADAFLPRYALMGDGRVASFYNQAFSAETVERGGGRLVITKEALELGSGVITTGEIARNSEFEGPRAGSDRWQAGLYQVRDGQWGLDEVWDEQALVINIKNRGLLILTGCGHAGVINTINHAMELTGVHRLAGVMGGFHLGFPTTPSVNISKTMDALAAFEPDFVVPSHCSGLDALSAAKARLPRAFVQYAVGTRFHIGDQPEAPS